MKRIFLISGFAILFSTTAVFSQQAGATTGGKDPKTGQLQKEVPQNDPDRLTAGQDTRLLSSSSPGSSDPKASLASPANGTANEPDRMDPGMRTNQENINPSSASLSEKREELADDPSVLKPEKK